MKKLEFAGNTTSCLLIENEAFEGVKKTGFTAAEDYKAVFGTGLKIISSLDGMNEQKIDGSLIFAATYGKSKILEELSQSGKFSPEKIAGKREVYSFELIEEPFKNHPEIKTILLIAGSDKRGTIYGMFHLSELLGVSPWKWWSNIVPAQKENFTLTEKDELLSKEPSVEFRGIFINDEWPAFGNWTMEKFGGFNAEMYEKVFLLILRLKGNYFWPAMWTSSFSLDGPGSANEILADIYGIIYCYSHHEPCLRNSEEWDKVKGKNTPYGTAWDFTTNSEGLTNYWRDSLRRSGKYENYITMGMRGERDSILNQNATLKDNIDNLKKIITVQNRLISEEVNADLQKTNRVLAVYKEVETYFEGDKTTAGLKEWDGLDGITCMLCEDNFGNMRVLPSDEQKNRNGGWGMYYHFDYHGGPVSYEWMNSTSLEKTRREMSRAYNHGIKKIWVVNVGDLTGNELPISYFIDLAYDFDSFSSTQAAQKYTEKFIMQNFAAYLSEKQLAQCVELIEGYTYASSLRKPEHLNEFIYHPCNYHEAEKLFEFADRLCTEADSLLKEIPDICKGSFTALVYYPAAATLNLLKISTAAAMNAMFARQGSVHANHFAQITKQCILRDNELKEIYDNADNCKWKHFADSAHFGFRTWNNEDWRWPVIQTVTPVNTSKMIVSFSNSESFVHGGSWCGQGKLENYELTNPANESVCINISNGGSEPFTFSVASDCPWISFTSTKGTCSDYIKLEAFCDRTKFTGNARCEIFITGSFGNEAPVKANLILYASNPDLSKLPENCFVEGEKFVSMKAQNGLQNKENPNAADFTFHINSENEGKAQEEINCTARIYLEAANPSTRDGKLRYSLSINGQTGNSINTIEDNYVSDHTCRQWCNSVMDNYRISEAQIKLNAGVNNLTFIPEDEGVLLKGMVIYKSNCPPEKSYLMPPESFQKK